MKNILSLFLVISLSSVSFSKSQENLIETFKNYINQSLKSGTEIDAEIKALNSFSSQVKWQNKCSEFINSKGLGELGLHIKNEFLKDDQFANLKNGTEDLNHVCPNYSQMNLEDKALVQVALLSLMSFKESTCDAQEKAPGVHGIAAGIIQLHLGAEDRYHSNCQKGDSLDPKRSLTCALSILDKQIGKSKKVFSQKSQQWQVLKPKRDNGSVNPSYEVIVKGLKNFSPCTTNLAYNSKSKTTVAQK